MQILGPPKGTQIGSDASSLSTARCHLQSPACKFLHPKLDNATCTSKWANQTNTILIGHTGKKYLTGKKWIPKTKSVKKKNQNKEDKKKNKQVAQGQRHRSPESQQVQSPDKVSYRTDPLHRALN